MINLFQSSLFAALPGLLNSILLRKTGYPEMNLGHVNSVSFFFYLSSVSKSIIALRSIPYLETWIDNKLSSPGANENWGKIREIKLSRFSATHVNRKWTFYILQHWFCPSFRTNRPTSSTNHFRLTCVAQKRLCFSSLLLLPVRPQRAKS